MDSGLAASRRPGMTDEIRRIMRTSTRGRIGAKTVEQPPRTVFPVAPAEPCQRVPDHHLIAAHHWPVEPRFDLLDHRERRDVGATEKVGVGVGPRRFDGAVAPELRRRRAVFVAALEVEAGCAQHLVAGCVQELGLLFGHVRAVGRQQHDAAGAYRVKAGADCRRGRGRMRRAAAGDGIEQALFALEPLGCRVGGAMKRNDIAARVDQSAGRLFDTGQEFVERQMMRARHAQPHHVGLHAGRHVPHHLLLDHPVRGRDDQSDAGRHAGAPGL